MDDKKLEQEISDIEKQLFQIKSSQTVGTSDTVANIVRGPRTISGDWDIFITANAYGAAEAQVMATFYSDNQIAPLVSYFIEAYVNGVLVTDIYQPDSYPIMKCSSYRQGFDESTNYQDKRIINVSFRSLSSGTPVGIRIYAKATDTGYIRLVNRG